MEFFLLGPVEARVRDRSVALGRRRERLLLGVLLLDARKPIGIERLVELLWEDEPTPGARQSLHSHVARLRSVLGGHGVHIATLNGAYVAEVDPAAVDAHRFRRKVERARQLTDHRQRADLLRHALELWRGPLLADVASDALRNRVGADLLALQLVAIEERAASDLTLGLHREVVLQLTGVLPAQPTRERLAGLLMVTLYRDGRQAEALAAYGITRDVLDGEFGLLRGAHLADLHDRILRNDRPS